MADVKRQWDEAGEVWTQYVRSGNDYYREYMVLPAFLRMVGDVKTQRILDLGCGEGYVSRILAENGATVTGIDISPNMISEAQKVEDASPLGIRYIQADACRLSVLRDATFDVVVSYMTLMDIEHYESAISEVSRVLRKGGRLVVALLHPCFATRFRGEEKISGWESKVREDGSKEYPYLMVVDYLDRCSTEWVWTNRVQRPFVTTQFNRTISDYVNTLAGCGLLISRMEEPKPTNEGVTLFPTLGRFLRVPQSIIFNAVK